MGVEKSLEWGSDAKSPTERSADFGKQGAPAAVWQQTHLPYTARSTHGSIDTDTCLAAWHVIILF